MRSGWLFLIIIIFLFIFSFPLKAYIDPGTGSYLLQIILASILAFLFTLKAFWRKIKAFFSRSKKNGKE